MSGGLRRLLREPLLHFVVLGGLIFVGYAWWTRDRASRGEIVVSRAQLQVLVATFERTWQRPPSADELAGMVRETVREEVAAREAIALGLDRDDVVVRRRLRQKLEFVAEDGAAADEPSDADLAAFLAAHPERFRREERFTFRQVTLGSQRGARLAADAGRELAVLRAAGPDADLTGHGDTTLLERDMSDATVSEVATAFGAAFARQLGELPLDGWQGPLESPFGLHLVLVRARSAGGVPPLAEVRDAVAREWTSERRLATMNAYYRRLLSRYRITIEPLPAAEPARVARAAP